MGTEKPAPEVVAYVEWVDAGIAATRWEQRDEIVAEAKLIVDGLIRSAGLLLEQAADYIVLAGSYNGNNDDANLSMVIPRSAIRRMDVWAPRGQADAIG